MQDPCATENNLEKSCSASRWNESKPQAHPLGDFEVGKSNALGGNSERLHEGEGAVGSGSQSGTSGCSSAHPSPTDPWGWRDRGHSAGVQSSPCSQRTEGHVFERLWLGSMSDCVFAQITPSQDTKGF